MALGSHTYPRRWFFPNTTLTAVHTQSSPPEYDEPPLSTTEISVLTSADPVHSIPPTSIDSIDEAGPDFIYSQNSKQDQVLQYSSTDVAATSIRPPQEEQLRVSRPSDATTRRSETTSSPLKTPAPGVILGPQASTELRVPSSEYQSLRLSSLVAQDTSTFSVKINSPVSSHTVGSELTAQGTGPVVVAPENSSPQIYDTPVITEGNSVQSQGSHLSALSLSTAISVKLALAQEHEPHTISINFPGSAKEASEGVATAEYMLGSNAEYTQTTSPQSVLSAGTIVSSDGESLPAPKSTKAEMTSSPPNERPDSSTAPTHGVGPANDALDAGEHGHSSPEKRASNAGMAIGVVVLGAAVGIGVFLGAKRRQKRGWTAYGHMASSNSSSSTLDFRCAGTDSQNTLERPHAE